MILSELLFMHDLTYMGLALRLFESESCCEQQSFNSYHVLKYGQRSYRPPSIISISSQSKEVGDDHVFTITTASKLLHSWVPILGWRTRPRKTKGRRWSRTAHRSR